MTEKLKRLFVPEDERYTVTGYMCGTDWECEIGQNRHGIEVYASEEALKQDKTCWQECGIVEVEVTIKRTVLQGDGGEQKRCKP